MVEASHAGRAETRAPGKVRALCPGIGHTAPAYGARRKREVLARKASLFNEYVRRSDLKDATPDAVDVPGIEETREVAGQAELERRIIETEQRRLGQAAAEAHP